MESPGPRSTLGRKPGYRPGVNYCQP